MKRWLSLILAAALAVCVFAACSKDNPLSQSILEYKNQGDILPAAYHGAPASWSSDVVGLYLMENYLTKEEWTQADYGSIAQYAVEQWKEMKNAA